MLHFAVKSYLFFPFILEHYNECRNNDLNVLVINFIDMLSHARTESGFRIDSYFV